MGKIIVVILLALASQSFARTQIQPQLQKYIENFGPNKDVMSACLKQYPSPNQNIGCVQAYRYMTDLCRKRDLIKIDRRYEKDSSPYFEAACRFYDETADHVSELFDLDRKNCAPGFETVPDSFITVRQNADLLDESAIYNYGLNTCKSYQSYVNLCTYVDGDLKTLMPKTYDKLPAVDFSSNPNPNNSCATKSQGRDTISRINQDLAKLARGGVSANVYETIIKDYRARKPAGHLTLPVCDEVRMAYKNMLCNLYEDENNKPKPKGPQKDPQQQTVTDAGSSRKGNY